MKEVSYAGASAGAIIAACMVCHVPVELIKQRFLNAAEDASKLSMGAFSTQFNTDQYLRKGLEILPKNAHLTASGKLFISMTRSKDMKNVIVSQWNSREELIQSIVCSCYIPLFSGKKLPYFRGEKYIDGGFTNNIPKPYRMTLTISPFASTASICPKDSDKPKFVKMSCEEYELSSKNLVRFIEALIPPPVEDLEELRVSGYAHAEEFVNKIRKLKLIQ